MFSPEVARTVFSFIYAGNPEEVQGSVPTRMVDGIPGAQHPLDEVSSELYNLKRDPQQKVNLLNEYRDIAINIHNKLFNFIKSVGTPDEYLKFWDKI